MNKDEKEKKARNRELTGGSVEVIGDQALCQCSNGSAQVPLKVTSQQKFYCNSASRLIATNGDKDGSSLNFGNCRARNNSPCMPLIQWKHFYDKILISDRLFPLTMRSEGTCLCGGTVSFVTSGQQVVVNPPHSATEAKRIAHTNPLFKEEDMHREAGTRPQRDNALVERHVPKASVTSVRVNGKVYVSPREYGYGPLLFTNTLTSGADASTLVKWDVTCNGEDIAIGLGTPPSRDLFRKAGEYKVFAYVNERGNKQGGGYVTVDVSTPKFESLAWKYANGEIADRVGKRCTVHAHLQFKGMDGVTTKARFCFWGGNGKQGLTDFMPLAIGEDGCTTMELALTEEQLKNIRGEQQAWDMKVLVRVEIVPSYWIEGYKRSIDYPIEYTDKEEIVSTMLYHDKDCKEKVTGFVECGGHTVYARVITRGFEDGLLTLSVFCHGNVPNDNTAATGYVYKIMGEVDEDGVCILEINTDQSWLQGKHSEMFDILVLGGCCREEVVITRNDMENGSKKNACKTFQMGKDKGMLLLALPKQEIEGGQSKTMVQEVEGEKHKCPRCEQDITLDEIKQICVNGDGKCIIEDMTMIIAALPYLNQYRKKVGINTCVAKAHFLAQIAQETKFYALQEKFKFTNPERMRTIFSSYFNTFGTLTAQKKEAKRLSDLSLNRNNWPQVANSIYGPTHPLGKNHKDKGDGWRYSGKRFKQITWKDNYVRIQRYYNQHMKLEGEKDVLWVGEENPYKLKNSAKDAITSALAYWGAWGINSVAIENSEECVRKVTAKINKKLEGINERIRYFNKAVEVLMVNKCLGGKPEPQKNSKGTVIAISGVSRGYGIELPKSKNKWAVYKLCIYRDMTYSTFDNLYKGNNLPQEDYITYVARDAHMKSKERSTLRYGTHNECPPGKYYLNKGTNGQKYDLYISDTKGKGSSYIKGPHGGRAGIAIHGGWPEGAVGCITTHTANYGNKKKGQPRNKIVAQIIDNIPDIEDSSKDVIIVLLERTAIKEGKLWFGIIE